jgi:hypothetical protein
MCKLQWKHACETVHDKISVLTVIRVEATQHELGTLASASHIMLILFSHHGNLTGQLPYVWAFDEGA